MKQYHYTVYVVVDDDGNPVEALVDDSDSGVFPEGTVYDPDAEDPWSQWGEGDADTDVDASVFLADVLAKGQGRA